MDRIRLKDKEFELFIPEEEIKEAIAKVADVPVTTKIVAVVDRDVSEQLYAISEADFLKYAHPVVKPAPETDADNIM